ncbi:lytic transglycosylase domain-containing protein [Limoniibacter endophyticus]|uniref:Lytic transglycosylase n=1 Tax=Limoniibacter endophyticus TaxID=1565040 RepID=A0A8J3DU83_9HYPH|nr:lytic transglycosylase domain-containing protein [Limoniibacter endophyticus]GHC77158.1 lytic transglycosylase [Limoniibacter endophyticus]
MTALLRIVLSSLIILAAWRAYSAERPALKPIEQICYLIADHADRNALPRAFFARLIWKESRFDAKAISPMGAQGIAQFMPGTAKLRGLADPFEPTQAIAASAHYLADLKRVFGNLGLAAAAYNAGEGRVSRWLSSGGYLPLETENYVLDIMGEAADSFTDRAYQGKVSPLEKDAAFEQSCLRLPIVLSRTTPMAAVKPKPWGIQVAGNPRQAAAIRQWERVRVKLPQDLRGLKPHVSRTRGALGRGAYAVRLGADTRAAADRICAQIKSNGGSCVVTKNR